MRKKFIISASILFISLTIFLGLMIYIKLENKTHIDNSIKKLPTFSFAQLDGKLFTNDNLKNNKGVVLIIYFDPDCDHCRYMINQINKNACRFLEVKIILVTNADYDLVKKFVNSYNLIAIKNLIVLLDKKSSFYKIFGSTLTPSFYIYKNEVISKTIKGETKIENLINAVK